MKHPAVFSEQFIPIMADELTECSSVLDPFAGTGRLAEIKNHGFKGVVICNEIEKEWAETSPHDVDLWHIGDASNMSWLADESISAVCTSPTYGNRMADHFIPRDKSFRITYRSYLGKDLNLENTGRMAWGEKYKAKHVDVYRECVRVLKNDGVFILNVGDHIRKGEVVPVSEWHKNQLLSLGLTLRKTHQVPVRRMRYGKNNEARIPMEYIFVFVRGSR